MSNVVAWKQGWRGAADDVRTFCARATDSWTVPDVVIIPFERGESQGDCGVATAVEMKAPAMEDSLNSPLSPDPMRKEFSSRPQADLPALDAPPEIIPAAFGKLVAQKSARARQDAAKRGEYLGGAPAGYRNVREKGAARVIPDPEFAPLIQEAFELAAGEASLEKILMLLLPRGLRSRQGKPMGPTSLRTVLTNSFYAGKVRFGSKLTQGKHEPLVSEELFDLVQAKLGSSHPSC